MKKILALALALMLCLCSVAFADEAAWDGTYTASVATSFELTKKYTSTENWVPGETLSFEIKAVDGNPDDTMISIGTENKYTVTGLENTIEVTVPSYTKAGVYAYTIKEIAGTTAGVTTYDTGKTINVKVMVAYDNTNHALVIDNPTGDGITYYIVKDATGNKVDTFENVFETNDFTVAKNVEGNMANESDEFDITVTLTSTKDILTDIVVAGETVKPSAWVNGVYTKVLTISESDKEITFADIPYGVKVTVAETETDMQGYTFENYVVNGTAADSVEFTIDDTDTAVVVNNTKGATVDTGIALDNAPYMIVLALVVVAGVMMMKKRSYNA